MCNWDSCWWEKVYDLIYSKRDFTFTLTYKHMKALLMVKNVFEHVFAWVFFNYLISWNLSDTSINTKINYASLINANPFLQRICRSTNSPIWKQQKNNMNNASSYFKLNLLTHFNIPKLFTDHILFAAYYKLESSFAFLLHEH